jgi:restriction system protein
MEDTYENCMRPWFEGQPLQRVTAAIASSAPRTDAAARAEHLAVHAYGLAQEELKSDLLGHIYCQSYLFFERLVLDLLLAMGYAGRRRDLARHVGRSHDGGIDGLIMEDELGLNAIYVQAKRVKLGSTIPVTDVRNFVGSLEAKRASKGVFLTTGQFTQPAEQFITAVQRRIVLIDGNRLAGLMIRHNVGVKLRHTYQSKIIDKSYFAPPPP